MRGSGSGWAWVERGAQERGWACASYCTPAPSPACHPSHLPRPLPPAGETYNSTETLAGLTDAEPGEHGWPGGSLDPGRRWPCPAHPDALFPPATHALCPLRRRPCLQTSCCWSATSREGLGGRFASKANPAQAGCHAARQQHLPRTQRHHHPRTHHHHHAHRQHSL